MSLSSVMVSGGLNIGSFLMGIAGLATLMFNLARNGKQGRGRWELYLGAGLGACAFSLALQIFETYYRVSIGDWSGLQDTYGAAAFAAAALLGLTLILSVITLILCRDRT